MDNYPVLSFHFSVEFAIGYRVSFSEVSGIGFNIDYEKMTFGGKNQIYNFPKEIRYQDLVLKRGLIAENSYLALLLELIRQRPLMTVPLNMVKVSVLDEKSQPVTSWMFFDVILKSWSLSKLDSKSNDVLVENLTLGYEYFMKL